jgi:hypothetical protein
MTHIEVEAAAPFAVTITVNGSPVVWQPYAPTGAPWASQLEAQTWADELALANISAGVWPPLG